MCLGEREVVGSSPLIVFVHCLLVVVRAEITAGVNATEQSLALIPLLANAGADPNIRTRFGEPILMHTIMTGETAPFKALLVAGGNLDIGDNDGLTPREMSNG